MAPPCAPPELNGDAVAEILLRVPPDEPETSPRLPRLQALAPHRLRPDLPPPLPRLPPRRPAARFLLKCGLFLVITVKSEDYVFG
ncbi:hypothetical protein HU200_027956 [Digitaria exilis]|uniref:Uncharacterized protein n=1 Tax=Digitaria exilis TaxID=1010633 RepID=A0A835ESX7_9POAL|nr:hypothetical protein HU200_027956 [Digitaria exilis]